MEKAEDRQGAGMEEKEREMIMDYIITDKEIDAAWGLRYKKSAFEWDQIRWALFKLNIHQCKKCGGDGIARQHPYGEPIEPCPGCSGFASQGWTRDALPK